MEYVVLSADGDSMVYLVPHRVAQDLEEYCMEFCRNWLQTSPHAANYRINGVLAYDEGDFIQYLNNWIFPASPSILVENLGCKDLDAPLPPPYDKAPRFNF